MCKNVDVGYRILFMRLTTATTSHCYLVVLRIDLAELSGVIECYCRWLWLTSNDKTVNVSMCEN